MGGILAGGRSSRMGSDKAFVSLSGTMMVEKVALAVACAVDDVVVLGRTRPIAGIPAVPDLQGAHRGPLAGLAAELAYAGRGSVLLVGHVQ